MTYIILELKIELKFIFLVNRLIYIKFEDKNLYEKGLSGNTVLHFHILIRECLQYAFKNDFVNVNVADKVDRPKTDGYKASFYTID